MNLNDIYTFGFYVQYARLCESLLPIVKGDLHLLSFLEDIKDILEENELCVDRIGKIEEYIQDYNKYDDGDNLSLQDAKKLNNTIKFLSSHLNKELSQRHILELKIKSGLDANELAKLSNKEPSEYFPTDTWDKLTDIEKSDFSDVAKCLIQVRPLQW